MTNVNPKRGRVAFTLVEILVVVVILGIASTLIIPRLSNADDLNAAAAARVVMADLTYAQNCAITSQKSHLVRFTRGATADTYSLLDQVSPADVVITHPVMQTPFTQTLGVGGSAGLSRARLGTVSLDGANASTVLGFDPLGSPFYYVPGNSPVSLSDAATIDVVTNGYTLRVSVEPYTGELSAAVVP